MALPGSPERAYLDAGAIVAAARRAGADAVHPGYGFLSEDADFADAVADAGLVFVGPPPAVIAAMADKLAARRAAAGAGIEAIPGGEVGERQWRYPVLVKAVAGGGGRGMVRVELPADLAAAVETASRQAQSIFGDDRVYVEELIDDARHIEVQVLADVHGGVVHLYDRECSVQRRRQKVIEEAPAPGLDPELRDELAGAACRLAKAVGYVGAGTVEFLVAPDGAWWFLEMNTRLQVEHPVTEAVTGIDLVEQQIRIARGDRLGVQADLPALSGHAVEARLLAEDPTTGDLPQSGVLHRFEVPDGDGVRVDAGVGSGSVIGAHYDPLLAKVIAHRASRARCSRAADGHPGANQGPRGRHQPGSPRQSAPPPRLRWWQRRHDLARPGRGRPSGAGVGTGDDRCRSGGGGADAHGSGAAEPWGDAVDSCRVPQRGRRPAGEAVRSRERTGGGRLPGVPGHGGLGRRSALRHGPTR